MKTKLMIILATLFATNPLFANQKVRRVSVMPDQIVTVKTSVGIATIIQVPDRPNSVVVGDQDLFKVEYLDQAITIKPLSSKAKTNLYIYTDWRRFNVELVSGPESLSDYVVYLDVPKEKTTTATKEIKPISWMNVRKTLANDGLTLVTRRIGKTKDGFYLIEFDVSSKQKITFKPDWIWITQNNETVPINNLFMSALDLSESKSISGVLQLKASDLRSESRIKLELRRKKVSFIDFSKVTSWKL